MVHCSERRYINRQNVVYYLEGLNLRLLYTAPGITPALLAVTNNNNFHSRQFPRSQELFLRIFSQIVFNLQQHNTGGELRQQLVTQKGSLDYSYAANHHRKVSSAFTYTVQIGNEFLCIEHRSLFHRVSFLFRQEKDNCI